MEKQLTFDHVVIEQKQVLVRAYTREIEKLIREAALTLDRTTLAALINRSYSYCCEMLNTNGAAKPPKVDFIAACIIENPDALIKILINPIAKLCKYDPPSKQRELTPEEELAQMKRIIKDRGLSPLFDGLI